MAGLVPVDGFGPRHIPRRSAALSGLNEDGVLDVVGGRSPQRHRRGHGSRDEMLLDYVEAYALLLERSVNPQAGWQAWR